MIFKHQRWRFWWAVAMFCIQRAGKLNMRDYDHNAVVPGYGERWRGPLESATVPFRKAHKKETHD